MDIFQGRPRVYSEAELRDMETALLWARRPTLWVEAMFGVSPTSQQGELLEAYAEPGAKVTVRSGHGTGKTGGLAWCIEHFLTFMNVAHDAKCLEGDTKVACTAPSGHQLNDILWPEVMKWLGRMRPPFANAYRVVGEEVRFLTGRQVAGKPEMRVAVARTSRKENPDALQGFHATNLLFVIDEAAGVAEEVFEVAQGALSTPFAKVIMTANPTKTNGFFYQSHRGNAPGWRRLHFSCVDSPLVAPEYVQDMLRRYGENSPVYRVRVLGEFPDQNAKGLIALAWVESALDRDMEPVGQAVAGLDVGRGGDPSALVVEQGNVFTRLHEWHTPDTMDLVSNVYELYREGLFAELYGDAIGVGGPVLDRLRQLGVPVWDVNVSETKSLENPKRFMRLRDELWWKLRDRFHDGVVAISRDACDAQLMDKFVAQLTVLESDVSDGGKLKVEGKKELKVRLGQGGESPNMADAAMMCGARGGSVTRRAHGVLAKKRVVKRVHTAW